MLGVGGLKYTGWLDLGLLLGPEAGLPCCIGGCSGGDCLVGEEGGEDGALGTLDLGIVIAKEDADELLTSWVQGGVEKVSSLSRL